MNCWNKPRSQPQACGDSMDIEFGNAAQLDTNDTGWFIGFSEWTKANLQSTTSLRYMPQAQRAHTLSMKWMQHPAHDPRGIVKPASTGRTVSILVSELGGFRLEFSQHPDFPEDLFVRYILRRHGDFVIWGGNLYHRWFADADSTILTLRWVPEE
jgi:hypothetical protein